MSLENTQVTHTDYPSFTSPDALPQNKCDFKFGESQDSYLEVQDSKSLLPQQIISDVPFGQFEYQTDSIDALVQEEEKSSNEMGNNRDGKQESSIAADDGVSAVQGPSDMQQKEKPNPKEHLAEIQKNCEAALDDIRLTNKNSHSVSAFLAIPAFIGFLAKLSFAENQPFLAKNKCKKTNQGVLLSFDRVAYIQFIERFILQNTNWKNVLPTTLSGSSPGISSVLYSMLRCGLLHGMTVVHPSSEFSGILVKLTHINTVKTLGEYDVELKSRTGKNQITIILNAFTLCDEIEKAISRMFFESQSDSDLEKSIKKVSCTAPTFRFYKEHEGEEAKE